MAAPGVDRFVAEQALNHKLRDVKDVSSQYGYFDEREVALERWAELLDVTVRSRNGDGVASGQAPK